MYWLRLIRWNNLLIILLTQWLAWWCVIRPLEGQPLGVYEIATIINTQPAPLARLLLTPFHFTLLCLSTLLIAAAGYIINDYFDIRIDTINKPDKVILEKQIPRRMAIIVHSVMNVTALLLAGILALQAGHPEWLLIQAGCTFLLWRYSTTWKRQFMTGNVVVALLTALSVLTLLVYEQALHPYFTQTPLSTAVVAFGINPAWMLYFLACFAFILTWMREIVKDMEDYKGDAEEGCVTMPIRWGLQKSVRFTRGLGSISFLVLLAAGCVAFLVSNIMAAYLLVLSVAIFAWLLFIGRRATKAHYHRASSYLKLIMVAGTGTLLIYRYCL